MPSLAQPEGPYPSLGPQQPSWLGTGRTAVGLYLSWRRHVPTPPQTHTSLGLGGSMAQGGDAASVWGSQSHCQAGEWGLWPATRAPKLPSALRTLFPASLVCAEERIGREGERKEERKRGREGGRAVAWRTGLPTPTFSPLPMPEAGRHPSKCSLAWLLRVGPRLQWETPVQGGRCA